MILNKHQKINFPPPNAMAILHAPDFLHRAEAARRQIREVDAIAAPLRPLNCRRSAMDLSFPCVEACATGLIPCRAPWLAHPEKNVRPTCAMSDPT